MQSLNFGISGVEATMNEQVNPLLIKEEMYIDAKDCKLYCQVIGTGEPVIILHGGPGLSHRYLKELTPLASEYKLIFFDQRGSGLSTGELNEMHMDTFVNDILTIILSLKLERVSFIAHSWGGLLGMKFAIENPQFVNKLVLMNSLPCTHIYNPSQIDHYMEGIYGIQKSKAFAENDGPMISEAYRNLFRKFVYDPESVNRLQLEMQPGEGCKGIAVRIQFEENLFKRSYDYQSALRNLNIPTLIIHGENDALPFSIAENLHRTIENSSMITIPQCGHFPNVEQPQILLDQLGKFLQGKG